MRERYREREIKKREMIKMVKDMERKKGKKQESISTDQEMIVKERKE
jgi:hypothetical protein